MGDETYAVVDRLFAELSDRVLSGRSASGKPTLPQLFQVARGESGVAVRLLRPYLESLGHHLEARRAAAKADLARALADSDPDRAVATAVERIESSLRRVLETEATGVRNAGALAAVVASADRLNVDDPIVYFVTRPDCCLECRRLFWQGPSPRVWRTSELGTGYHRRGDEAPKVGGCHPNCRCSPVFLPPGYGFRGSKMSFIGRDHDEHAQQRESIRHA